MQEQKKFKYVYNGQEVSKEDFEQLSGETIKWFEGNSVFSVPFDGFFDGNYKSKRQINEHLKDILGGQFKKSRPDKTHSTRHKYDGEGGFHKDIIIDNCNKAQERFFKSILPMKTCLKDCLCDGSCKKEIKEPFSIQVPKPTAFYQSDFFDKKQQEQEILDTFKRNMDKTEGIKETEGKLNYELDWDFIQQIAERMSQNKGKYEPYNWTKPMDVEKLKQSLFRHVIEVMKGNYLDDGREFGHLESIALNAMMINYQLKNNK